MTYRHGWLDGSPVDLPVGKAVCVGRNYAEHARELGNAVPDSPILFLKPATAFVPLEQPLAWPAGQGECHFETEVALLVGETLQGADAAAATQAVVGVGLALDLTLRDLQAQLKAAGHPWERAKAFDGACAVSRFCPLQGREPDWGGLRLRASVNGTLRQDGHSGQMLFPVPELLATMSQWFTLEAGDVILTGTPPGVGPLRSGDRLDLELEGWARFAARVA